MKVNTIYTGDFLETLKSFPDESVDCVITSPPYWQLRDYGWSGQWGLEQTFNEYLQHLWALMDEIRRVLKPTGTVWINLGDTYSTQGGKNTGGNQKKYDSTYLNNRSDSSGKDTAILLKKDLGVPSKCLLLIPHRFAIGCIDRGWIIRNDIVWAKRNGMPESVTDRFSKKHEYFFFMTKSVKYYFDLEAIKDNMKPVSVKRLSQNIESQNGSSRCFDGGYKSNGNMKAVGDPNKGKNPGSVSDFWDIPTMPSSEKHYATYNTKLIDKPILAGCPKGGVILDPFCGTATTGHRAIELGRKFVGIEGNVDYVNIANKRLHPHLITQTLF